ncbi:MAG: hypothetical protein WC166_08190 [Bacteroidales bacterium]
MRRDEGWKCLVAAIATQAVKDYRKAQERLAADPLCESAAHTLDEVRRFFRSDWYQTLCDVNPGIIGMAEKEGIAA